MQRGSAPFFTEVASHVDLTFVHTNGATGQRYMPEIMGAGAALVDYDDDGDLDVFLVQGGSLTDLPEVRLKPDATRADVVSGFSRTGGHRLFRNDMAAGKPATLRFTDVTPKSGIAPGPYGMGVAAGDYDNDGDQDLYVTAFGANVLYRNNGDGTFSDVTKPAGVEHTGWSSSAAFVDYDRDGDLDLFVANYLDFTRASNKQCFEPGGARDYCSPRAFKPVPDRLFRNEGNGTFSDATDASGITKADGAGLGVSVGDYNGDGWLDLYVANDATPNQLWMNQRNGTFVDEGPLSGAALNAAGNPEGSMGIASGDYDADGDEDLFVTNIIGETFALYANDGSGSFEDVRVRAGIAQATAAYTGFGTEWVDYDNDGWLDLFVANGAVNIVETQRGTPVPFRMRNQLLRNLGSGRFRDVTREAGPALQPLAVSRAAAIGDIDNDGDTDIVVTINNGPVQLLLNQSGARANWVQVRPEQEHTNRRAFGARVGVERNGQPTLWRRVGSDGSYVSAKDPVVQFGLGSSPSLAAILVEWPDGARERFEGIGINRRVVLRRGTGRR